MFPNLRGQIGWNSQQLFNLVSNYFRSQALAGGGVAGLFGDGSDGALDIVAPALLGGVLNYTTFSISAAGSVNVLPDHFLVVRATRSITINGPISGDGLMTLGQRSYLLGRWLRAAAAAAAAAEQARAATASSERPATRAPSTTACTTVAEPGACRVPQASRAWAR